MENVWSAARHTAAAQPRTTRTSARAARPVDSLGAEGWELVAVTDYPGTPTQMYFKRPQP